MKTTSTINQINQPSAIRMAIIINGRWIHFPPEEKCQQ